MRRLGRAGRAGAALALAVAFVPGFGCSSDDDAPPAGVVQSGGNGAVSSGGAGSGRGGRGGAGNGSGARPDAGQSNAEGGTGESNGEGGAGESSGGGRAGSAGEAAGTSAGEGGDASGGTRGGSAGGGGVPVGPELCGDGDDNDGDGDGDCDDDDCVAACASCDSVDLIEDPSELEATTIDRPAAPPSDCVATGPALIYEVIAATTGFLEVEAQGSQFLRTSILAGCDDEAVEACGTSRASAAVNAGERRFVRIAGLEPADVGDVSVSVHSRAANVCGDGYHDPSEGCDDGQSTAGDGCDADCRIELTETEPNQDRDSADAWAEPFFAEIAPEGDEDFVTFDLEEPGTLVVETLDLDARQPCANQTLDSYLELFDASGDPLDADDDAGAGLCARLERPYTQAGRYFVRITASPTGVTPTFPYRLVVGVEQ
ncbi:MAG TPA: hypothetical protein VGK73_29695 [Polyangiaceae bacterium]